MSDFQNLSHLEKAYQAIGVPPRASAAEIKRAYRRAARKWHPDKWPRASHDQAIAAEKMKTLNEAYDLIKNAPLRVVPQPPRGPTSQAPSSGYERAVRPRPTIYYNPLVSWIVLLSAVLVALVALRLDPGRAIGGFFRALGVHTQRHTVNFPADTEYAYFPPEIVMEGHRLARCSEAGMIKPSMRAIYSLPDTSPDQSAYTAQVTRSTKGLSETQDLLVRAGLLKAARQVYRLEDDGDKACVVYQDPEGKPVVSYHRLLQAGKHVWALTYVMELGHEPTQEEIGILFDKKADVYRELEQILTGIIAKQLEL